jgi:hypothetical protein
MTVSGRTGIFTGKVDPITDCLHAIENEHAKIHGGRHFFSYTADRYGSLDSERTGTNFLIIPPTVNSGYKCHFTFKVLYFGAIELCLEEDITYTGGSAVSIYNNDRASATSALTQIKQDVAITGGTRTQLVPAYLGDIPNGLGTSGSFSVVRPDEEIILNGAYNYILKMDVHNSGELLAGDNVTTTIFQFYEHVNIE